MHNTIKFIKFNIIGFLMTIFTLVIYSFLLEYFQLSYLFSNAISYIIPVIISFYLNEIFTFKIKLDNKRRVRKFLFYMGMKLVLLVIDLLLLFLLVSFLDFNRYIAKIINIFLLTIISYKFTNSIIVSNL